LNFHRGAWRVVSRACAGPAAIATLDPCKDEFHRVLREHAKPPGQRIRELIVPLGFAGLAGERVPKIRVAQRPRRPLGRGRLTSSRY
jgi:hypothetical protein